MKNLRTYGNAPFSIALIHGGPGAPGEMISIAREISTKKGVLEPFQTAMTIEGEIKELKNILEKNGDLPVTLVGWSWGAWLSFIFSAKHPTLVKKLILIGSGPFEEKYVEIIMETRQNRMSEYEKEEVLSLMDHLNDFSQKNKNKYFARFGKVISKPDSFNAISCESKILEYKYEVYQNIWPQASELRKNGQLLEFGKKIKCPVVAIHGDYDPHPAEGVKDPLSKILDDFRFILLEKCGHYPWIEKDAREKFYSILKNELE